MAKKIEDQTLKELEETKASLQSTAKVGVIVWLLITLTYIGYIGNRMLNHGDPFSRFDSMLGIWVLSTITILFVIKSQQKNINDELGTRDKD